MELLMENKEKIMDDYLFVQKFVVSQTGLKMLYRTVLVSTIHCIIEMISNHYGMPGDSSDEVSWFLSPLPPKAFSVEGEKNNLFLEGSALSIALQKVHLLSKFSDCSRSKIRLIKLYQNHVKLPSQRIKVRFFAARNE